MAVDVVYTIGRGCEVENYWELRMSLRSLSFFKDLGKVFIVGYKPNWIQNIVHVPARDPYTSNKDANLINKLILATTRPELSDEFVWFSDDQYLLKPVSVDDIRPPLFHNGPLIKSRTISKKDRTHKWHMRVKRTAEVLKNNKRSQNIFEMHCPYVYRKELVAPALFNYEYGRDIGFLCNTLYFNETGIGDSLGHQNNTVAEVHNGHPKAQIQQMIKGKMFMSLNVKPGTEQMSFLKEYFPKKSIYEA